MVDHNTILSVGEHLYVINILLRSWRHALNHVELSRRLLSHFCIWKEEHRYQKWPCTIFHQWFRRNVDLYSLKQAESEADRFESWYDQPGNIIAVKESLLHSALDNSILYGGAIWKINRRGARDGKYHHHEELIVDGNIELDVREFLLAVEENSNN